MALYDDRAWLLSHISHSFVLSDEFGVSEACFPRQEGKWFVKEVAPKLFGPAAVAAGEAEVAAEDSVLAEVIEPLELIHDDDLEFPTEPHSFNIRMPGASGGPGSRGPGSSGHHRPRSNTEIKLEKMRIDKRSHVKVKTVYWKETSVPPDPALWQRTTVDGQAPPGKTRPSLLSRQFELLDAAGAKNPFAQYSHLDATNAGATDKIRRIMVYLDMAKGSDRDYPIIVQVADSATVEELIGLIAWKYTQSVRDPELTPDIANYSLYMADEDGTIEKDFPPLEKQESISKYGFNILGLVDCSASSSSPASRLTVPRLTVTLPDGTFTVIQPDSRDVLSRDIIRMAMARRKPSSASVGVEFKYHLEKKDAPGKWLDESTPLAALGECTEFFVVRENSRRREVEDISCPENVDGNRSIGDFEAPCHAEFSVIFKSKMSGKVDVIVGLHGRKFEICPKDIASTSSALWKGQKSLSFNFDDLTACELKSKRGSVPVSKKNKVAMRVKIRSEEESKWYEFEGQEHVILELHSKILSCCPLSS